MALSSELNYGKAFWSGSSDPIRLERLSLPLQNALLCFDFVSFFSWWCVHATLFTRISSFSTAWISFSFVFRSRICSFISCACRNLCSATACSRSFSKVSSRSLKRGDLKFVKLFFSKAKVNSAGSSGSFSASSFVIHVINSLALRDFGVNFAWSRWLIVTVNSSGVCLLVLDFSPLGRSSPLSQGSPNAHGQCGRPKQGCSQSRIRPSTKEGKAWRRNFSSLWGILLLRWYVPPDHYIWGISSSQRFLLESQVGSLATK